MREGFQVILCTHPDKAGAVELAQQLLTKHLAACINIVNHVQSIYQWQGKIKNTEEQLLIIKTHQSCYHALEALIQDQHPYEVPEIIALPIQEGLGAYLTWLGESLNNEKSSL